MFTNVYPTPGRPTFGVEVEFLIATLPEDAVDPIDATGLAPVLRTPKAPSIGAEGFNRRYILDKVKEAICECFSPSPKVRSTGGRGCYLDWQVDIDPSISEMVHSLPYTFMGVEIGSPIQFSSPNAFDVISRAISAITSKYRCMVNLSCGLHVHVGLDQERLSLEQIRRIASLSYAVEPFLFTLHDPLRRVNNYCKPLQDYSYLANKFANPNLKQDLEKDMRHARPDNFFTTYCQYLGAGRRHGEAPLSLRGENVKADHVAAFLKTRQPRHFEPFTQPGDSRRTVLLPEIPDELAPGVSTAAELVSPTIIPARPARQRKIPRLKLPRYSLEELVSMRLQFSQWGLSVPPDRLKQLNERGPGPSVSQATQIIYSQPGSDYISELLSGHDRPAIAFHAYDCTALTPYHVPRTIEFRLGEGSLDSEWIPTWAKICVGIFKFALYSSPSEFTNVLEKCNKGMKEEGGYDVIDLLDDTGLFAEAVIAEKRLMANKEQWSLAFVESDL
ncbi:putative amidoligase enzyme-domain-containing protein [Xylaria sp. FL1042]|nr:putative amidoligase enzyme-domain-containing protein [Xylaria sp. FL1042]